MPKEVPKGDTNPTHRQPHTVSFTMYEAVSTWTLEPVSRQYQVTILGTVDRGKWLVDRIEVNPPLPEAVWNSRSGQWKGIAEIINAVILQQTGREPRDIGPSKVER